MGRLVTRSVTGIARFPCSHAACTHSEDEEWQGEAALSPQHCLWSFLPWNSPRAPHAEADFMPTGQGSACGPRSSGRNQNAGPSLWGCSEGTWPPHMPFSVGVSPPKGMTVRILGIINENESLCWAQNLRLEIFMVCGYPPPQETQSREDVYKLISTENSFLSPSITHSSPQSGVSGLVSDEKQTRRGPVFDGWVFEERRKKNCIWKECKLFMEHSREAFLPHLTCGN